MIGGQEMFLREDRLVRWHLFVAFIALLAGGLFGPMQALNRMGVNLYPVLGITYYQGLTLHGVLVALVWTTFFMSVPVGLHHQFADPGISQQWKGIHTIITFAVAFPSLLTAFNVIASLEIGGRARGGRGLLGWILRLPWGEPSFAAQALAIILFAFGGIGGLINASYNLNLVVHNTAWVSGHLHLTVGSATTLTFAGIAYWLVPLLTGRELWSRRLALAQAYLWFGAMSVFSFGMHWAGLLGEPRRTDLATATYGQPEWWLPSLFTGIGGTLLLISLILLFWNLSMTTLGARQAATSAPVPVAEAVSGPEAAPAILGRWGVWVTVTLILVAIGYGPVLVRLVHTVSMNAVPYRVW